MTFVGLVIFVFIMPTISANCTRPELPPQRGCFLKIFQGQCKDYANLDHLCKSNYIQIKFRQIHFSFIWLDNAGTCTVPPPTNGTRTFSTQAIVNGRSRNGTRIGVKCNDGYYRTGPLSSECENGIWKPSVPMCIPNDQAFCSKPEVPHGSIYLNSHLCSDGVKCSANFVAVIKCDQNYYLTGFGYARCKEYEEWHPSVLPQFEATCAPLAIANGQVETQELTLSNGRYDVGTTVYFSCKDGYSLDGSHSSTCQNTGTWSPQSPSCIQKSCEASPVKNSKIAYNKPSLSNGKYPVGTKRTFRCKRKYNLDGPIVSVCLPPGPPGSPGSTTDITCKPLSLRNGFVKYIKHPSRAGPYPVDSRAIFFRNYRYKLKGSRSRTCRESGKWDRSTPKCKRRSKGNRGCFPSEAEVMLTNGKLVTMSGLQVGDQVQTVSSTGTVITSEVTAFAKQQPNVITMYKSITTLSNQTLTVTEDHLVYARKNFADSFHAVYADQISIGDELLPKGNDKLMQSVVINVSGLIIQGAYVPLSEESTILVDGVLTSCYAGYHPVLAHFAIMPMQLFSNIIEWALGDGIDFPVLFTLHISWAHYCYLMGSFMAIKQNSTLQIKKTLGLFPKHFQSFKNKTQHFCVFYSKVVHSFY